MTYWFVRGRDGAYAIGRGDHVLVHVLPPSEMDDTDGAHWAQQTAQYLCTMLNDRERKMRKLAEEIDVE